METNSAESRNLPGSEEQLPNSAQTYGAVRDFS